MRKMWGAMLAGCFLLAAATSARADVEAELKGFVDKAIKAIGSEAKVKKLAAVTLKGKGTADAGGQTGTFTFEGSLQGFDQARLDLTMEFMGMSKSALMVVNGDKGWAKVDNKVEVAPKDAIDTIKGVFYALRLAQQLAPLKDKACTLSALGEVQVDNKPAVGIKAVRKGLPDVDIFFDKKTGILVKCQLLVKEKGGMELNYEFFFSAYKDLGGVKHFTKIATHRDGKKTVEFELSEVKAEGKLGADLFAKPE